MVNLDLMVSFPCYLISGGRLHCLYPWWADATVDFMISGGYNVSAQIQLLYANLLCHLNQQMLLCLFVLYIQKRNPCYKTNGVGTTLREGEICI